MRSYGSVQVRFWDNPITQKLSDQAKLMAIYLMTGPHSNMIGCFRLPDGYITEDLNWNVNTVKSRFQELININFLTRDSANNWLILHDYLKQNPVQNPKQGIGVQKLFNSVPRESTVNKPLVKSLITYGRYLACDFIDLLKELSNRYELNSESCITDTDKDQVHNKDNETSNTPLDRGVLLNSSTSQHHYCSEEIKKISYRDQSIEVLDFLNSKAHKAYKHVDINLKLIEARLKSGATIVDCRQIIAKKVREWKGNPKMDVYLRPATLFSPKNFEQYIGELILDEEVTSS